MIALVAATALAGPWTKAQGEHYVKAGADFYHTTKFILPREIDGLLSTGVFGTKGFFGQQYSVYAEVGVSDGHPIQLAVRAPVALSTVQFEDETNTRSLSGTTFTARGGDLELAPQIALSRKVPVALQLQVKIPLYGVDAICPESVYRDYCGRPGDGQTDFTGMLLAGGSLLKGRAWVEGWAGYRHRTELFRDWDTDRTLVDSVVFSGVLGGKLGSPAIVMLRLDGNKNLVEDPYTLQAVRAGPAAMFFVWRGLALEARAAWDLWARNTSKGVGFGTGISWSGKVERKTPEVQVPSGG